MSFQMLVTTGMTTSPGRPQLGSAAMSWVYLPPKSGHDIGPHAHKKTPSWLAWALGRA